MKKIIAFILIIIILIGGYLFYQNKNSKEFDSILSELDNSKIPLGQFNQSIERVAKIASQKQIAELYQRISDKDDNINFVSKTILIQVDPSNVIPFIKDDLTMNSLNNRFYIAIVVLTKEGSSKSVALLADAYNKVTGKRAEQITDAIFNISNKDALPALEKLAINGKDFKIRESAVYAFGNFDKGISAPYLERLSKNPQMTDMKKQLGIMQ